ncbi:peptidase [Rothia mucilaginosa]|uniref:peptidase n=1 Tax=Rothia mucilaginosa TaxID=43675 RepID=UPI003A874461
MNLASSKAFKGLAVGSLALAISGVATIPASFAADSTPVASQSTDARTITDKAMAKITQGLPGQFQVAYSKKTNKIWVAGTADRDKHVSTIARIDANSLKIEAVAELPIVKNDKGYQYDAAYGITVDDVDGTVWVTNTTDNSVSVYDQATMQQVWTTAGIAETDPNWIEHPRSVLVDHESGKAFVTGRFFVSAIDLKTKQVEKIQLEGAPDGGTRYISMNILVDGGKLYVPERTGGKIFVIDTKTFKVESSFDTKGNAEGEVRPSDIAIDHSQNEIYVSSQGVKGANSGVSIYDATTHEFKKFIPVGAQALALDNDEANDLVYVSDFGTGKVGVIDGGAADKLIAEVAMNGGKANDLVVLPNGSVVAVDKQAGATATVPYVLDGTTGTVSTSDKVTSKPSKDKQGNEVPAKTSEIQANSILKFKVTATAGDNSEVKQVTPETREFQGYPATATKTKVADNNATTPSTEAHRTVDANGSVANIIQGLPGQFQVGYSKKNHKLFVPTVGARGGLASSLARVNADTLQTEAFAELPVKKNDKGQYGYTSAYGVTVDDVDGTVWVTNTTDNSVAVYDQQTLKLIWTNEGVKKDDPNWIEHPRSVLVDHESGKAFVTGRFFVSAIDLKTKQVEKIQLEGAPDGGTRYISMNLFLDGGKLYVPERTGGKLFVVDTKTFKVEKTIQTQGEDSTVEVRPSDVAVDHSLNEIYVSSQGVKGVNSGISVYDLTTGEFKKFVKFGTQALALEHDEDRDLVYVTDFGTGKVAVFDGRADEVIGEVEMNGAAANDVTLLKDGSVLVVDKKDRDEKVTLPYVLNGTTGEITTASEYTTLPTKDRQGNDVPASVQQLKANSILKFKVGVKDTDASAAPVGITPTSLDFAGYPTVTGVKAEESKPADPKAEDKKAEDKKAEDKKAEDKKSEDAKSEDKKSDAKSENTAEAKDQTSKDQASQPDSKSDAKTGAQDSKSAPDAVKADKSGSAVKNGGSSAGGSDNLGGGSSVAKSDAGSSQTGSSRGALANTGANAVMPLVAFASVALIAGAALVMRRRKA